MPAKLKPLEISAYLPAAFIILFFSALIVSQIHSFGMIMDEVWYFDAATHYFEWLRNPHWNTIDAAWNSNREHPPLQKIIAGLAKFAFNDGNQWLNAVTAYRLGTLPFLAAVITALYWLGYQLGSRFEAWLAPVILLLLPRVFFQAHLLSLDFASMAMWTSVSAVLWKSYHAQKKYTQNYTLLGIVCGLAALSKINAPYAILVWPALLLIDFARGIKSTESNRQIRWLREITAMFYVVGLGVFLFFAGWPWLFKDTRHRIYDFLFFFIHHNAMETTYFGAAYSNGPWHYPFGMVFATTPILVVLLIVAWLVLASRKIPDRATCFILLNAFLPMLMTEFGPYRYDGVRLILPSFPFLALMAASALRRVTEILREKGYFKIFRPAHLAAALCANLVASNYSVYPYLDSFFSEVLGGTRGADHIGFDLDPWCDAFLGIGPWMKDHHDGKYWVWDCGQIFTYEAFYKRVPVYLPMTGDRTSARYWVVLNSKKGRGIWKDLRPRQPVFSVMSGGVPIGAVFDLAPSKIYK